MKATSFILILGTLLLLGIQLAAARPAVQYAVSGVGTTVDGSGFNVHVNWLSPGNTTTKGGVNLKVVERSRVVYQVATDKNTLPKILNVTPDLRKLRVPVYGYARNFTVRYSSLGSCGPRLTAEKTAIIVTVTDTPRSHLTVACPEKNYSYDRDAKPTNPFIFQRVK